MAIKLARIKQVNPFPCSVLPGLVRLVSLFDELLGKNVTRLPEWGFLFKSLLQYCRDVVLRPWRPKVARPFELGLSAFCVPLDPLLFVHNAIELVAHPPGLGLRLDLVVAVDGATTVRERADPVTTLYGAG